MKIKTPIITLLVGVALAVVLLIGSMSAVSAKKAALAAASASAAASAAPAVTTSSSASGAAASASQSASATASAAASASASGSFVIPPHANYDGEVQGNLGAVAIVVHDTFAIAYFCNGKTIEAWFSGTPDNGKLNMTGKGAASVGATLTANYALGHARGTVVVKGVSYVFSIIAVHKPSGLFQSIANVRGATVKAGWIVLANGTEVGSLNPDVNAANPVSQAAPKLDLSTLTADDGGTTITATPIDAETGTGLTLG
jgi:serine/threonine-protein kinase